jgi:hypothetical protein
MRRLIARWLRLTPIEDKLTAEIDQIRRLEKKLELEKEINEQLRLQVAKLQSELGGIRRRNETLSDTIKKYRSVDIFLKDYASPIPPGETARREYMGQVAGYYEGVLKQQLLHMSTQFKNQAAMFPLTERETDFFRACINVIGLLMDWGEECVAEHRSNVLAVKDRTEQDAFQVESEDAVENIRRAINE